jgi:hypothetical protein
MDLVHTTVIIDDLGNEVRETVDARFNGTPVMINFVQLPSVKWLADDCTHQLNWVSQCAFALDIHS